MAFKSDIWRYFTNINKMDVTEHLEKKNIIIEKSDMLSEETIRPSFNQKRTDNKIGLINSCGCVSNLFCKYGSYDSFVFTSNL